MKALTTYRNRISLDARVVLNRLTVLVLIGLLCLPTISSQAVPVHSTARSAAMAGAFTGLAKGLDAPKYNPANLGLDGYQQSGLELFSLGANITNNSFTLSDYNNYTGAVLSNSDKQDILDKIPGEGLRLDADIRASALSFAAGNYAFCITGVGAASINLNKDLVELILEGNSFADMIEMNGSYSDAISYVSGGLSYGRPVYNAGTRQLAVGATLNYIKGIAAEKLVEMDGSITTNVTGFDGRGRAVVRTATGGSGYGLDLGAALRFNDTYTLGARIQNFLGSISWNKGTEEHGYWFDCDSITYDDLQEDDIVASDNYTIEIDGFSTTLPTFLNVGIAKTSGQLLWAVDWVQGLENTPGATTKPQLAGGAEYTLLKFLPVRAGCSIGAGRSLAFSFGSGVRLLGFYLDIAVMTGTSFTLYSAKGANFALSSGLQF